MAGDECLLKREIERRTQCGSLEQLDFDSLYDTLRRIAQSMMQHQPQSHTLQATALLNEAYLKIGESDQHIPKNKNHLLALASVTMRQVLVDHARAKKTQKRGGDRHRVTLSGIGDQDPSFGSIDVLALHEALESLETVDQRQAELVQLRYFGGLTIAQASDVMDISTATLEREWRVARAWLAARIHPEQEH